VGSVEYLFPYRFATLVREASLIPLSEPLTRLRNVVYIGIFFTVEMAFTLVAASYFAAADAHLDGSVALQKAGGVFAFLSGLLGYYTVANLMCQQALRFKFPMGDTSRFFAEKEE
jgi:uncharacterized protein